MKILQSRVSQFSTFCILKRSIAKIDDKPSKSVERAKNILLRSWFCGSGTI
jgi:hypothetical protein